MRSRTVLGILAVAVAVGAALFLGFSRTSPSADTADGPETRAPGAEPLAPTPAEAESAASLRGSEAPAAPRVAEPPAELPPGARRVRVHGKVVDERMKPVAGADVAVLGASAETLATGRSDEAGAFEVSVVVPAGSGGLWGQVRAKRERRVGLAHVVLRSDPRWMGWGDIPKDSVDAGTIHVKPAASLDIVVKTDCAPTSPVLVTVTTSGYWSPTAAVVAGPDGRCRVDDLVPGSHRVVATATGCGRAAAMTAVPREGGEPLVLTVGGERVVEVEVVEAVTDAPIEGAVITVSETISTGGNSVSMARVTPSVPVATTDAQGRTRVGGLGRTDDLSFAAEAPGFGPETPDERHGGGARAKDDVARIVLHRKRRVEIPVVAGERPVPPEGTTLRLTTSPGSVLTDLPKAGRIEGGRIVVDDVAPGWLSAYAVAPDGAIAILFVLQGKDVGRETSFDAPRAIDVTLHYVDGAPAEGFWISVRNQGNNPMGTPTATDADGKARIEGLHGQLVQVYASDTRGAWGGISVGSVDLEKGGGSLSATVERERRYLLTVRVDGVPRLPEAHSVRVGFGFGGIVAVDEKDFDRGTIRFRWRPPTKAGPAAPAVTVESPGFLPSSSPLPPVDPSVEGAVTVDLVPAARVVLRVIAPPRSYYRIESQSWDETKQEWRFGGHDSNVRGGGELPFDPLGVARLDSLAPGRYRFVDATSGASTAAVDARAGSDPVEVRLDLSAGGWVKGKVLVPDGESARGTRVRRVGGAASLSGFGGASDQGVSDDGTFMVRVPGDVPVTLEPVHPVLVPAPDGRAVVTKPVEGVVLRLVAGARAVLRVDRPVGARNARGGGVGGVPVLLFRGEPHGAPIARLAAAVDETTLRFGGFDAGTYTLWIDASPFEPVVLRSAVLGEGETDLGAVTLSEGRKIVLRVLVKEGQAVPRTSLWAMREGEPSYARIANLGEGAGVLTGLGPDVFKVSASPTMGMGAPGALQQTVDLTSATEATVTLDLRGQ